MRACRRWCCKASCARNSKLYASNHQAKYKHLYKKYAATAIYVAELKDQIQNGQKYDINEVRDINNRIKYTIEDIQKELESEAV